MRTFTVICLILSVFVISGCSQFTQPFVQQRTIAVQETQYVDAKLIVGKTTKKYVLDALGTPDRIMINIYSYSFSNSDTKARLSITLKDGTTYNLIMGRGEKHSYIGISFDSKGIISSITFS